MLAVNTVTKIHSGLLVLQAAKTKIAAAAIKIFNFAMNANPIMKVVSAIGLLVGGIALLSKKFSKSSDDSDALKQHIENVTGSIHSMRDAFDNAKVTLPNYDKLISYKGNTLGDIDEQISQKEALITDAIKNAIKEQKGARDEDIRNIRQYMKDIQGLEEEKLSIHMGEQSAQIDKLKLEFDNGNFDQQNVSDILASAKEMLNQTNESIEDAYSSRLTMIRNNQTLTKTAQEQELKDAYKWYKEQLNTSQGYYDEAYNMAISETSKRVAQSGFNFSALKQQSDEWQENNRLYYEADYKEIAELGKTRDGVYYKSLDNARQIENLFNGMNEEAVQSTNDFLLTLNTAKNEGVNISNDAKLTADEILGSFKNLPPGMQETGQQILVGLLQGMTDENGNVIDTTDMTCQELVDAAREVFDVHSPSRVFAEIGTNIGLGLLQGISLIMPVVVAAVTTNMLGLVTSASGFNLDGMGQNAESVSETVVLAFSNMNTVSCQHMSGMQKSVVLITKLMSTAVIVNLKTMSVQAVIIVQAMSVSIVSTMNQMKSSIDGLDLYSTGINVMNGLINGMESRRGGLVSTAQSIAQTVKNTMNNALDIHSPSRELYKTGVYTGLGQINGMKSTLPEIQQTANNMANASIPENERYTPSSSPTTNSRSTTSENHTYAPTFNLTISGTSDDRTMARKVKKWISEALEETFSSYESKNATVREI